MKVSRNEPCPCGSGEKYKRCCGPEGTTPVGASFSKGAMLVVGIVIALGAVALTIAFYQATQSEAPKRVWSEEHQHWHNEGTTENTNSEPVPQPGPAPPGKVWSPEHGHWHDAVPQNSSIPIPQPPGDPPPGKVWSPEHGHWHDEAPAAEPNAASP